mmetsp:Transcript_6734/g.11065  ORF Transcript_6734/g.11065 Transcript_6734/m.11065 type:complete len:238 (-) Transcript_6734:3637-4350(-)
MRSTAFCVHLRRTDVALQVTLMEELQQLITAVNTFNNCILDKYHFLSIHLNVQFGGLGAFVRFVVQQPIQVHNRVIVKLHEVCRHTHSTVLLFANKVEHFPDGSRCQTRHVGRSCHGERLTRSSLSVSEQAHIKAINHALHKALGIFKHLLLCGSITESSIKLELFIASTCVYGDRCFIRKVNTSLALLLDFVLGKRTYSSIDSNSSFQIFQFILIFLSQVCFLLVLSTQVHHFFLH